MNWLLVFLGGGIGATLRYGTVALSKKWWQHDFPLGTLISNVLACLLLGVTLAFLRQKVSSADHWNHFIVIGVCGGYSTFSSFAKENLDLFGKGHYVIGILNILLSLSLCFLAVWMGRKLV